MSKRLLLGECAIGGVFLAGLAYGLAWLLHFGWIEAIVPMCAFSAGIGLGIALAVVVYERLLDKISDRERDS